MSLQSLVFSQSSLFHRFFVLSSPRPLFFLQFSCRFVVFVVVVFAVFVVFVVFVVVVVVVVVVFVVFTTAG